MIDVYATGTMFPDTRRLAPDLAAAVLTINRHCSRVCAGGSFPCR